MVRPLTYISVAFAVALAGCSGLTPPLDEDIAPVAGPAPRLNTTPMAAALACMRSQPDSRDLRIGVADFVDGTGVMEGGTQNSRAVTQRPDLMMVVALAAAGAHLVNRSSVNVTEWEMNKAMEKKLGDGHPAVVDHQPIAFRPIRTGVILGSTDYITGAVTELNWNIDSGVAEAGAYSVGVGRRTYRISVAIDVVVTDTQSTEIVFAKSYKKQLVGFETNANFFRFVNENTALQILSLGNVNATALTQELELFDANLDEKQNEPTQTALRWVIELAAYDVMRDLKHASASCDTLLPPESPHDGSSPDTAAASGAEPVPVADDPTAAAPEQTAVAAATGPVPASSDPAAPTPEKTADEPQRPLAQDANAQRAKSESVKAKSAKAADPAHQTVADTQRRPSTVAAAPTTAASPASQKHARMARAEPASGAAASAAIAPAGTSASAEKSNGNAESQASGNAHTVAVRWQSDTMPWINGAVTAPAAQLSQAGWSEGSQ